MQQQDEPDFGDLQQQQQSQATPITDTPHTQILQRPDECGVCLFVYNELERRPRTLPCGHSYCSVCVCVLLEDGHLICPSCRTDHCAPEVNHFPICYSLEAMMKVMRRQQVEAASQAIGEVPQATPKSSQATETKTKRRATAGLSRKLRSMIQEQKVSIDSLKITLQKELEQLKQYQGKLSVSRAEHAHMVKELDKLVQQHQVNMDLLQEEDVRVEGFVEEGEEVQMELRAAQGQLDQVNTAQEAFTTIDAADHTIVEVEEWLQHSREDIPNGTVLRTSFMVLEATKEALNITTKETEAAPDQTTSGHMNCTVMEAVESIEGGPVELVDLCSKKLRKKLEAGQVFATQEYADDTCYSSKVICKENKLYLHALKKESPPRRAFTLQVSKTLKNLSYPSISVFLDLAWPGKSSQRIHIQLRAATPLTRQFVTLCLGHTGLTYCNTNLLSVENHNYNRIVWGGDISGQKAAANQVLPSIQGNQCGTTVSASRGMVVAGTDVLNAVKRTWFGIVIGASEVSGYSSVPFARSRGFSFDSNCFNSLSVYQLGSVDNDELSIVKAAVNDIAITNVRVVDCGIVC